MPQTSQELALAVVEVLAKSKKYLLFGDENHGSYENIKFVLTNDIVDIYAKAGKKHFICEEREFPIQDYINDFIAGKNPKEIFIKQMAFAQGLQSDEDGLKTGIAFAKFVEYANSKGIKIHAVGVTGAATEAYVAALECSEKLDCTVGQVKEQVNAKVKKYNEIDKGIDAYIKEGEGSQDPDKKRNAENDRKCNSALKENAVSALEYLGRYPDEMRFDQTNIAKDVDQERTEHDVYLANKIKKIVGDDPAVIVYGSAHGARLNGTNGNDLDELLGNEKVARIVITPTVEELQVSVQNKTLLELGSIIIVTNPKGGGIAVLKEDNTPIDGEVNLEKPYSYNPLTELPKAPQTETKKR